MKDGFHRAGIVVIVSGGAWVCRHCCVAVRKPARIVDVARASERLPGYIARNRKHHLVCA